MCKDPHLYQLYSQHFLPPVALITYSDAACMCMPYAPLGTLGDVIAVMLGAGSLGVGEHEVLCMVLSMQVSPTYPATQIQSSLTPYKLYRCFERFMCCTLWTSHIATSSQVCHMPLHANSLCLQLRFYSRVRQLGAKV